MLGDVIELSVVVRDIEEAIKRFETMFDLKVCARRESKEFGFKNAILPLGRGHIELLQPTDPNSAVGRYLEKHGEGVYLVGFESKDVAGSAAKLKERGAHVTLQKAGSAGSEKRKEEVVAWVHPKDAHGVFVELRTPEKYK